jgi:outer membrane protein TolC
MGIDDDGYVPVDLELQFFKLDPDVYGMMELAMRTNPDIRIKQYALESTEFGTKIYEARKYPKVELRGSYGMLGEAHHDTQAFEEGKADIDTENEWFAGVNAAMPLGANSIEYDQIKHVYGPTVLALTGSEDWRHRFAFNLFDKLPDITDAQSAQAAYLQAQVDLNKAQNDLIVKIKDDCYTLKKGLVKIDSVVARIRYQEKRNKILEYTVSLQESPIEDLLDGLSEQAQNRFSFIEAVADYHIAISSLSTSIGDPNAFEDKYKH